MKTDQNLPNSIPKHLWHIFKAAFFMVRKGLTKRKLVTGLNLHLLLERTKLVFHSIADLLTVNHPYTSFSAFTCRSADPAKSFYAPRGDVVEFSCSNTPKTITTIKRRKSRHGSSYYDRDVAAIAKAFEALNSEENVHVDVASTPSPGFVESPRVGVRPIRITDSPFPLKEEEEGEVGGWVDREAEEFIRRFYEQLEVQRRQQSVTPERHRCGMGSAWTEPLLGWA